MICIDKEGFKLPTSCGQGCSFNWFDADSDTYICVFFKRGQERVIIDDCATQGVRYANCPVVCEIGEIVGVEREG